MIKKLLSLSILGNFILVAIILYMIHALGGFSYLRFKMKNRGIAGVYQHRLNLFKQLPVKKGDIVFLGNSITEQCEWAELFINHPIKNRGIAGDMADGVLKRLEEITTPQPAKIFLMIGINDLIIRRPKEILDFYQKIIAQIKLQTPATKLFIQSILPLNNQVKQTGLKNSDVLEINKGIQQIAYENQLKYIDLHALLKDEQGQLAARFTKDGIHINGDAYLIWKEAIEALLVAE